MPPSSSAKAWSGSGDRDSRNSLAYDNESVKFARVLRSVTKGLVIIVAFALPLIFSLVRVQDDVERSVATSVESRDQESRVPATEAASRLARLTVYWPDEGDHYTRRRMSSTGVYLRDGHCAVDPKVIPYGSVVKIPGMGEYVAVDTGSAVVSRRAARRAGRTSHERSALVVDIFCSSRSKAQELLANAPEFAVITWYR